MTEDFPAVALFGDNADRHELADRAPILAAHLEGTNTATVDVITDQTLFTEYVDKGEKDFRALPDYDALILYHPSLRTLWSFNRNQLAYLESYVEDGGGVLALHSTLAMLPDDPHHQRLGDLLGGTIIDHGPLTDDVVVHTDDPDHPITADLDAFTLYDEPYNLEPRADVTVHARVEHESIGTSPAIWTAAHGDGRVCYFSCGHAPRTWLDPEFRTVVERAVDWVIG